MKLRITHLTLILTMAFGLIGCDEGSEEVKLPPDAQRDKENIALLFEIAEDHNGEFFEHINTGETRLRTIEIPNATGAVDGEKRIPLSPDLVQVMPLFAAININGSGLVAIEAEFSNPDRHGPLSMWTHRDEQIRARVSFVPIEHPHYEGYELIFKGKGTIESVRLYQEHGVSPVFNDEAWNIVGGRYPVLNVSADVYPEVTRSINGITTLEEKKFKRVYAGIDGGYENNPEAWAAADFFKPLGFYPGRQIAKIGPELEEAYGYSDIPLMTEDPNRAGWADYSFFDEHYLEDEALTAKINEYWPEDLVTATCLDFWPTWNRPKGLDIRNDLGTPAPELFDSAADLAARYVGAMKRMQGRVAPYWEVKNESTIKHEWMYHDEPGYDSWGLLAEFHNKVANRIKADFPELKVGGPTSAWMALDVTDFALARSQMRFMDLTKDHLDFYSHHFYEGKELVINDPGRDDNPGTYLPGRLEADLDLLQNHMVLTDNVKPLIISETGTLHHGPTDIDHWILLKNFNSLMIRYMNRADEFELVVPFIIAVTWWEKDAVHYLMKYRPDGSIEPTKQANFLKMWSPYRGDLVPATSSADKVWLHAVRERNTIQVAINNMNHQRMELDLNVHLGEKSIKSIEQTRLYLEKGELQFRTDKLDSLEDVPVAVEETTIVKITLDETIEPKKTWTEQSHFGDKTLLPTGEPATFTVACPDENLVSSTLRVSFGRTGGFSEDITVDVNGQTYEADLAYSNKPGRFFGFAEFDIPVSLVGESNTITATIPQDGGRISTVVLENVYAK